METKVYFIRHAQSDRSVKDGRVRPLTEHGRQSALELVGFFDGIAIDAFYASPYPRAVETIQPLARSRGVEIATVNDLHEHLSGGVPAKDYDALYAKQWADFSFSAGGETLASVEKRNIAALETILRGNEGKTLAVGTHGMALSVILHHYDERFGLEGWLRMLPVMPYVVRVDFDGLAPIRMEEMTLPHYDGAVLR
jgi:2,3-bisphosphoglycerate-dependent phosphoglycerate mutase